MSLSIEEIWEELDKDSIDAFANSLATYQHEKVWALVGKLMTELGEGDPIRGMYSYCTSPYGLEAEHALLIVEHDFSVQTYGYTSKRVDILTKGRA